MAITRAQQAKQVMNESRPMKKIKGQDHMLAYITPKEAGYLHILNLSIMVLVNLILRKETLLNQEMKM